ncbi:hypothetical protein [Sphingorhabdus sp. EL138]|uniref:hypothetical protein n=1 Tax=Sphingorhabdus sp. EL138 TaxID=2073156 RepID=UPI0020B1140A|nr:hypothetical protein [Sphingorhabdus sp. EL138]
MKGVTLIKAISASAAAFMAFSVSAPAQAPELALLNSLQKGEWTLKARGSDNGGQKVCLGDPGILLQIKHSGVACSRYVIQDTPNSIRVSYKCGSFDHGVTTIKRESSGLVQIQSQGIEGNAPFSFSVEGRRTGTC